MPQPARTQPPMQPPPGLLPPISPNDPSASQETATRVPTPETIEATQATLKNRSLKPVEKPGFLGPLAHLVRHPVDHFLTDRIDKIDPAQIKAHTVLLREKLDKSSGSTLFTELIQKQSVRLTPLLLDLMRDQARGSEWVQYLEYMEAVHPKLVQEYLEVNLLKMMDNLVQHVRDDAKAKGEPLPINSNELLKGIMSLASAAGGAELEELRRLQESDTELPYDEQWKLKWDEAEAHSAKILQAALPHGSKDLILPGLLGAMASKGIYALIESEAPRFLLQISDDLRTSTREHLFLQMVMDWRSSDGVTVSREIKPLAGKLVAFLQGWLKEAGGSVATPGHQEALASWLESNLEFKEFPLLRNFVSQFLKDCKDSPEMKLLFQNAETLVYPLFIHVLANQLKHADQSAVQASADKSVLSIILRDVLKDLLEFAKQHPKEDFKQSFEAYQQAVAEIEKNAQKEIENIEKEFGNVNAPEMVARKVLRDNQIAAVKQKGNKLLEETKSPFDPLIDTFMQKMGLDEEGLALTLPMFQKWVAGKAKSSINTLCMNYYQEYYLEDSVKQAPEAAKRMAGYQESRQLLQDIVKKASPDAKKMLADGLTAKVDQLLEKTDESNRWYRDPLHELAASPEMDTLQTYAEPYIIDAVSDLFVHLADSNPYSKGQEKVNMLNSALQHLALIAVTRLKDAEFIKKMDALAKMAEGPEKENEKKTVLGPLAGEILQKADRANIRLPKFLKGIVNRRLENEILPDLLYRGMELWLRMQQTTSENEKILQSHTSDGDAVAKAMKVLADQTGAAVSDMAKKVGVAIETPERRKAGYVLRDAIVKAIDQEPALKSLNDPLMRGALIQMLKGAQDDDNVRSLIKQSDKLSYSLLMHVLARFTEKTEGRQSTVATVVNSVLGSVFGFAAAHREELAKAFSDYQAAAKTPEAKKAFTAQFVPLVQEIVKNAGLDPEGLSKVVPFGSGILSARIQSETLDFCVDFYEEVVATEGKVPKAAKGLPGYAEARRLLQGAMRDDGVDKGLMSASKEALAKDDIRGNIQTALADVINDHLFAGRLTFNEDDKNWIMQPVKELVEPSSPHLIQLESFVQPYLVDSVSDLLAHLAVSYQPAAGETKGDMLESATAHLIGIMAAEIKDPELVKKLTEWKALPEEKNNEAQRKAKAKAKDTLRGELFNACSAKILEKAGWDQLENIRVPKALRPLVKNLMEKTVLPDQLFTIAIDMLVPQSFSNVDERRLEKMGGRQDLRLISDGIAEKLTPVIFRKTKEYADLIAAKANEKLVHNGLSIQDEAWLGKNIDSILEEGKNAYKPARNFVEGLLGRTIQDGLAKLALNYEPVDARSIQGDLAGNIALYLRDRLKTYPFKPALAETIRIYSEQMAPLKAMDKQITELRKLAIREHPRVGIKLGEAVQRSKAAQMSLLIASETEEIDRLLRDKPGDEKLMKRKQELPAKIAAQLEEQFKTLEKFQDRPLDEVLSDQKTARKNMEMELDKKLKIKETYQSLLKTFEPEVRKILKDMGYPDAKSLPVPYLRETLWKNLETTILPDLCLTYTEKLIDGYDALLPAPKEFKEYEEKLTKRYVDNLPAGVRLPPGAKAPLVNGVYKLSDYLVKEIESQVALKGKKWAGKGIKMMIPELYGGQKGREAALQVDLKRKEIAQWMGEESPEILELVKDRMGKSLRQVIAAPLFKCTSNVIENLKKMETENPDKLFEFIFHAVPLVSEHFKTATGIAEKQGKTYIHEVNPLLMLREFQNAGKLHPAMPGWSEMMALTDEERYVKQLEEQVKEMKRPGGNSKWYEHVDKLKGVKGAPDKIRDMLDKGPDYYLTEAKKNCKLLKEQIDIRLKKSFYNDFNNYLLKMGGINGPQDLPGGEEFWNLIGMSKSQGLEMLNEVAPMLLLEGMRAILAPDRLNSYMATLLKSLNEFLIKKREEGFLEELPDQKPPAHKLDPKVEQMEKRIKDLFKQMEKMLPGTIVEGLKIEHIPGKLLSEFLRDALKEYPLSKIIEERMAAAIEKLPEKLPKTFEDLEAGKKLRLKEDVENIANLRKDAESSVPNVVNIVEKWVFDKWKGMQRKVDGWLDKTFGSAAVEVKKFFDKIFRAVFITLIMWPLYKASRWMLSFGIEWYGRRAGRFTELARQSIVMPPDPDDKDQKPKFNINGNLMLRLADTFKEFYPAPA